MRQKLGMQETKYGPTQEDVLLSELDARTRSDPPTSSHPVSRKSKTKFGEAITE